MAPISLKILLIEPILSDLATFQAALPGITLFTAPSVLQGLTLAQRHDPDVILLNLNMPTQEACVLCRQLKADALTCSIPVVFVITSQANRESRIQGLDAGADAFLARPLDEVEVVAQIRAMVKVKAANLRLLQEQAHLTDPVAEDIAQMERQPSHTSEESDGRIQARYIQDQFFEQPLNLHLIADFSGVILRVNHGWERLLGYSKSELIGRSFMELVHVEDHAATLNEMEKLKQGSTTLHFENRYRHKSGEYRLVTWSAFASVEEQRVYAAANDITERMNALTKLDDERRRLAGIVEGTNVGTWEWNVQTGETIFNERWAEIIGYTLDELAPTSIRTWVKLAHPDDLAQSNALLNRHFVGELSYYDYECRMRHKDGHWIWVQDRGRVFSWTEDGKPLMMFGTHMEITERKLAEKALRESEERFRVLADDLSALVCEFLPDSTLTYMNKGYAEYFGLSKEALHGQSFLDLIPEADRDAARNAYLVLTPENPLKITTHRVLQNGELQWQEWRDRAIFDEQGKVLHYHSIGFDVTERKRTETLIRMRLELFEFAATHSRDEVLQKSLDLVGELSTSPIGFYHFVERDQKTISLSIWSTRTMQEFCRAEGAGLHQAVDEAGVWADAIRQGKPVVHNDYVSLSNRHGLPDGHAEVIRELVVPILRGERIVAILGVGNKPVNYTQDDVEIVAYFADVAWEIAEYKQAEAAMRESEANLRKAQAVANLGSWIWRIQTNQLEWSEQMYHIFGIDRESFGGDLANVIAHSIHPDDRMAVEQSNLSVVRDGVPVPLQYRIVRADRSERIVWAEAGELIQDTAGCPAVLSGIVQDITERVHAEQERTQLLAQVQAQAQQIRQIMDTVPEGVLLLDAEGRVLLANTTGKQDLATLADASVGDKITRLGEFSLDDLFRFSAIKKWHEIQSHARIFEVIAVPVVSSTLNDENCVTEQWVVVINEVTKERSMREQLQIQERLAAVGQLAAGIAHDFNNILTVIALHTSLLARSTGLTERDRERLDVLSSQTAHAAQLIQQILDFSRRSVLELRPLDLGSFVKEQVKLLTRTLPETIQIFLHCEPEEYIVMADPTRIQQVIMNLAVNARDAMPEGGTLILRLTRVATSPSPHLPGGSWIQLEVTDTGVGIPAEALVHIFEPFFTTKPVGHGTGLGLAQVHGIVLQHNGSIVCTSVVGQGTALTIHLPAIVEQTGQTDSAADSQEGNGQTILLVEDNDDLLRAMIDIVDILGYTVISARNGVEALALLEDPAFAVDLVLTDLSMPVMGGEALLETMQARGITVPMVILSGYPLDSVIDTLKRKGLAAWLMKPPKLDLLAQILTQVLEKAPRLRS